ncbi:MAG: hypothetical protein ABGY95_00980 [Rubritalea sp.]|uniref:PQQ-dependent sugar dehydrogenase n=1 Tax=Rubritalea sp. TaxID=2109375 RepID=UPI003241FE03
MKKRLIIFMLLAGLSSIWAEDSYKIEDIVLPKGVDPQIGALAFMPDGRLMVSFNYGKVFAYNPSTKKWKLFAEGLQLPLGMLALNDKEVLVMQRAELTKMIDHDGDGVADSFEKVYDGFGVSGNYHEYAYGPIRDKNGNLYVALNVASNNGGITPEVRGEFKSFDASQKQLAGKFKKKSVSRMYSCVPYRGWVIKISPDGTVTPYASGVRSPNGLGFDHKGRLLVTDNQGDWMGTSKLHHIEAGKFYGHPASLVWDPKVDGDPMEIPVDELNNMRTPAAAVFPHGLIANSPTQPLLDDTAGKFGPFSNQMIIGEMNQSHLVRFIPDEVAGSLQGAVVPFLNKTSLGKGNNRLAFAPDGSLWVGRIHLKWAGSEGLKRIVYTGKPPFELLGLKLTADGFDLTFTKSLDPATVKQLSASMLKCYFYEYHEAYGSKQMDMQKVVVRESKLSKDGRSLSFTLPELKEGYVYEFDLKALKNQAGQTLVSPVFSYNLIHKLR